MSGTARDHQGAREGGGVDHIVAAGLVCLDIAPALADESPIAPGGLVEIGAPVVQPGGCVANTGAALAGLGLPVVLAATIADDAFGRIIRDDFSTRGLSTSGLQVTDRAGTSYSLILQEPGRDRTIWHYPGANAHFDDSLVDVAGARLVHFGYPSLMSGMAADGAVALTRLFTRARLAGATTSLDLAVIDPASAAAELDWRGILDDVLAVVDVFTPSLDDLTTALGIDEPYSPALVERLADWAVGRGVGVVAISAGEHGMYLRAAPAERLARGGPVLDTLPASWPDARHWQPPFPVASVATTNGAGDALTAGLLYGMWFAQDVESACRTSAACAGIRIMGRTLNRESLHRALQGGPGDES